MERTPPAATCAYCTFGFMTFSDCDSHKTVSSSVHLAPPQPGGLCGDQLTQTGLTLEVTASSSLAPGER